MLKQKDAEGKKHRSNDSTMPNLAEDLIALLTSTCEYCTPGHRMGHGYDLLIAGLTEVITLEALQLSGMESVRTPPLAFH